NGEYLQEKSTISGEMTLGEEDLARAKDQHEFTKRLSKKGYATQSELEADRIAVTKATIAVNLAKEKMKVLEDFTYKRQMAEFQANAIEFERELTRVKLKAAAALAQYESTLSAQKLTAEVERSKLQKLQDQIDKCVIRAPRDGLVVYANTKSGRGSQEPQIYEGAKVRERQALIYLPDVSKMQVNVRVHESKIDLVREKLPAIIRVDALPGEKYHGIVSTVSLVPMSGNWPNINLKEYATIVSIQDDLSQVTSLKPGLTAEVDIFIEKLDSVLQVPVQAIIERGGKFFAFVASDDQVERREIKVGKTNTMVMEIQDGLNEGESVVLMPRSSLPKEIQALEAEFAAVAPTADSGVTVPKLESPAPGAGPQRGPGGPGGAGPGGPGSGGPGAGGPGGGGPGGSGGPGGRGGDPMAFFQKMDANGDGKLVESEMPERMRERFATMDANGDKSVDAEEFKKASANFRGRGPGGGGPPAAGG
ncbi:MAG TPA: efflux RND transporter periplasmic adaptor subunit, partial [Planctomycetaceae bacterium]|nr:efflux RND transporter periplasmic adaptor subunit [Planctomycetaceae bacterium]